MYNPAFEIPALPAPIEAIFEVNLEDAVHDQYLAWRDESYGFIMTILGSSHSEVELEAARLLILDKEWQVKYSEFYETAYAYVVEGGQTWTRLFKDDLRTERWSMIGKGEDQLAKLFAGLMDQIDEAVDAAYEREDRAYSARSAGRFAKAS